MKKQVTLKQEFIKGVWKNNPVLIQLLGLCPVLAVTVSAINGLAMGLAATFVLFMASLLISTIRKTIPPQVRIASFIVIIATFVTIVDLVMKAKFPDLSKALGPFIPLIVVNCMILGRQEAFASKHNPGRAILDALGMGTGFTIALIILGSIREIIGSRTIFSLQVLPNQFEPWLIMILPAGAFLTLGLLLGLSNVYTDRKKRIEHESIIAHYKRVGREELIDELEVK
ncbi:MAG: electron transport complex subunit E [Ignavibacteria bacterium]|nr:electron transport complex subunit E [Ignavibacteria bacterium]